MNRKAQVLGVLVLAGFAGGSSAAAEHEKVPLAPTQQRAKPGFFKGYLAPRLNAQLAQTTPLNLATGDARSQFEAGDMMLTELTQDAQQRAQRATIKAVRNFLFEETSLSRVLSSVGNRRSGSSDALPGRGRDLAFDFGISHGAPRVEMKSALGGGQLRMRLGLSGHLDVDFKSDDLGRSRVALSYSLRDQEAFLSWRVGF